VTRRRPLSYDARRQNLSAPAPLPYFKPRMNGKFFVPEPGDEAPHAEGDDGDEAVQPNYSCQLASCQRGTWGCAPTVRSGV
jgi:hypothetical protein